MGEGIVQGGVGGDDAVESGELEHPQHGLAGYSEAQFGVVV